MPRKGENIRKRTDGRWEGRYPAWDGGKNRRITRSVYAHTYAEVKEKLATAKVLQQKERRRAERKVGRFVNQRTAYDHVASEWLDDIRQCRKHSTYIKYGQIYEKHLRDIFSNLDTMSISLEQMAESLSLLTISSRSLTKSIYSAANQILKYAHDYYGAPYHRLSPAKGHSAARPIEILTQAEQSRFLKELYKGLENEDKHYRLGILLCLYTGLRLGEICALRWSDIDLDGGLLYVNRTVQRIRAESGETKTVLWEDEPKSITSKREIPLPEVILDLLRNAYDGSEYIVSGNRPTEPRTMYNHYQKHLQNAGIAKKKFHCLRHTFATNCVNAGVDTKSLSEILGHADVSITLNRYVHPTVETKRKHMNALSGIMGQYLGQGCIKIA